MILENKGYSYDDLRIVPAKLSNVRHRSDCNVLYEDGMLPLFTAPMSCIVDESNYALWEHYKINAILPRTVKYAVRKKALFDGKWVAVSLEEFKKLFISPPEEIMRSAITFKVCIDLANGHMASLYEAISAAKSTAMEHMYKLVVMTGNIANPETYGLITEMKYQPDYIRVSIGSGNGCLTSSNTGVHYPIATLIDECRKKKAIAEYNNCKCPKIVADGGIRNFKDINIALALGADYVMVGSVFASLAESSAKAYVENGNSLEFKPFSIVSSELDHLADDKALAADDASFREALSNYRGRLVKKFYGMSTKEAQDEINLALEEPLKDRKKKTSEGVAKFLPCTCTVRQWVDNFISYLRSAMSYTGALDLKWFTTWTVLIVNSSQTVTSVNK